MTTTTMAVVAGAIVVAAVITLICVMNWPRRHRDPHDGMAVGCLMIVIAALMVPLLALLIGVLVPLPGLVRFVFYGVIVILAYGCGMLVVSVVVKRSRERRWAREGSAKEDKDFTG